MQINVTIFEQFTTGSSYNGLIKKKRYIYANAQKEKS